MHKELARLQEKIGQLEQKVVKNGLKSFETQTETEEPKKKAPKKTEAVVTPRNIDNTREEELNSLYKCKDKPLTTTRVNDKKDLQNESRIRCVAIQGVYRDVPIMVDSKENKENCRNANTMASNSKSHFLKEAPLQTQGKVFDTKHDVLIQLTESLESGRNANQELKIEVEKLKSRCSMLEQKYDGIRMEFDELQRCYAISEKLRKRQKELLKELGVEEKKKKRGPESGIVTGSMPRKVKPIQTARNPPAKTKRKNTSVTSKYNS